MKVKVFLVILYLFVLKISQMCLNHNIFFYVLSIFRILIVYKKNDELIINIFLYRLPWENVDLDLEVSRVIIITVNNFEYEY